jgi:hypothetical protein
MEQARGSEHSVSTSNEPPLDGDVLTRAKAEFLEMPGLHLTERQAARLWGCSHNVSEAVLIHLTGSRFLMRTRNGSFTRA